MELEHFILPPLPAMLLMCFSLTAPSYGDLRLVGGGWLEIYYHPEGSNSNQDYSWGTVCSDGFDKHDADLACQQLGYEYSSRVGTVGYVFVVNT